MTKCGHMPLLFEWQGITAEDSTPCKNTHMISVQRVSMYRAFENACKFVKTIVISIQKILACDHISSLYD